MACLASISLLLNLWAAKQVLPPPQQPGKAAPRAGLQPQELLLCFSSLITLKQTGLLARVVALLSLPPRQIGGGRRQAGHARDHLEEDGLAQTVQGWDP